MAQRRIFWFAFYVAAIRLILALIVFYGSDFITFPESFRPLIALLFPLENWIGGNISPYIMNMEWWGSIAIILLLGAIITFAMVWLILQTCVLIVGAIQRREKTK